MLARVSERAVAGTSYAFNASECDFVAQLVSKSIKTGPSRLTLTPNKTSNASSLEVLELN